MRKNAGFITALSLALAATAGTAAIAQTPPAAAAIKFDTGAIVHDSEGKEIGPIASSDGTNVVVTMDGKPVALPANAFQQTDKGLAITITHAQLSAALNQQAADASATLEAAFKPGAEIRGVGGKTVVGTVKLADAEGVVVTTPKGEARVPRKAFFLSDVGLQTSFTAEQFAEAVAEVSAAPTTGSPKADTGATPAQ
ncbi:MAG: hypothetical protein IBJ13_00360 [Sphingopyxis sp.]|nr:hypothetical protein [Sphingopyxis sp.]